MKHATSALALALAGLTCGLAQADTGKLRLTGGVSSIDGAAGGGLTPWAVIGTNATEGEIGEQWLDISEFRPPSGRIAVMANRCGAL